MDDRKLPHPLDYEKKPPFPWLKLTGYFGLIIYLLLGVGVMLFGRPEDGGACIGLSLVGFGVGVMIWVGIKYGTQKKDFWF